MSNTFTNKDIAKRAGSKSSKKGKKHFATQVIERLGANHKKFSDLYILSLERQLKIIKTCKDEQREMTSEEIREFEALSKVTGKAFDKILPNLQESDIRASTVSRIEIVDLTEDNMQIPQMSLINEN